MMPLFTYGTLEWPEIMAAVTGRRFPAKAAVLDGYARYLLRERTYPGIIAREGCRTVGTLYLGLDGDSLRLLDRYEDDFYERRDLLVKTTGDTVVRAFAYVIPAAAGHLLSEHPWDPEQFARLHGPSFRKACAAEPAGRLFLE